MQNSKFSDYFFSDKAKDFYFSLLVALAFIFLKGYPFNCSDQEEHLPLVYKLLNPSLYPHDYFVQATEQTFTVRFFFVRVIYFFSFIMPVSIACFLVYLICLAFIAKAIMRITTFFTKNNAAIYLAPVLLFLVFNSWTVGGNYFEDVQLTCSVIANAFCCWSIYFFLKKNYKLMALLAGTAALFQVLMGLHLMVIFLICILINDRKNSLQNIFLPFLIFVLASAAMLFPILYKQIFNGYAYDHQLFYKALYQFRNANHYLPSQFPIRDYVESGFITTAGLFSFYIFKLKEKKNH